MVEVVVVVVEVVKFIVKNEKEKMKEKEREFWKSVLFGGGKKKLNNVLFVWK